MLRCLKKAVHVVYIPTEVPTMNEGADCFFFTWRV